MLLLKIDTSYPANANDVFDVAVNFSSNVTSDDGFVALYYRHRHPYIRVLCGSGYVWFFPVKTSFKESFRDLFPCDSNGISAILRFPVVSDLLKNHI